MSKMPKIEIIPSINESSFEEVDKKIELVSPYVDWVHLDISDGQFTNGYVSWHDARDLIDFEARTKIEVHLMIADMDFRWRDWILPNVDRIIFHLEAAHDPDFVIEKINREGKQVGLAVRPETPWVELNPFFSKVDLMQTLAVFPGMSGQKFQPEILNKIRHIREKHPQAILEVDGGVDLAIGGRCIKAGANILVSGAYIFKSGDIKKAVENLKHAASA